MTFLKYTFCRKSKVNITYYSFSEPQKWNPFDSSIVGNIVCAYFNNVKIWGLLLIASCVIECAHYFQGCGKDLGCYIHPKYCIVAMIFGSAFLVVMRVFKFN